MTALTNLSTAYRAFRRFDLAAGKLFGAPKELAEGYTPAGIAWYAMGYGARIVLGGIAAVFLYLMSVLILSFHEPLYTAIANVGYGLGLVTITYWINPRQWFYSISLILELAILLPIAFVMTAFRLPTQMIWNEFMPSFAVGFGMLVALWLIVFIGNLIAAAFDPGTESEKQKRRRRIWNYAKTQLTSGERRIRRQFHIFAFCFLGTFLAVMFMVVIASITLITSGRYMSAALLYGLWLVGFGLMALHIDRRSFRAAKAVIDRLGGEAALEALLDSRKPEPT